MGIVGDSRCPKIISSWVLLVLYMALAIVGLVYSWFMYRTRVERPKTVARKPNEVERGPINQNEAQYWADGSPYLHANDLVWEPNGTFLQAPNPAFLNNGDLNQWNHNMVRI